MDEVHPLMREGEQAYLAGEPRAAWQLFDWAVHELSGEQRTLALINRASMADALGDPHAAISSYQEALAAMAPDAGRMRPAALVNMSQALQNTGDLAGAQQALEQAHAILAAGPGERDKTGERAAQFAELRIACLLSLTAIAVHRQQWATVMDLAAQSLELAIASAPQHAGHALSNLAAANFGIGRWELAADFFTQALQAFSDAGNPSARAETQYNLALLYVRTDRLALAGPLLSESLDWFAGAGMTLLAARVLKTLGIVADAHAEPALAQQYYQSSWQYFANAGSLLEVASVQALLATHAFAAGAVGEGEALLANAFETAANSDSPAGQAQVDYWHAHCLESLLSHRPELLTRAVELAVPAALALDATRATLANGQQRAHWTQHIAGPAMRLAFRLAARLDDGGVLLADLIETQCAGTTLADTEAPAGTGTGAALQLLAPLPAPALGAPGPLQLGSALAATAASTGLTVAPPPQLQLAGRLVLGAQLHAAARRYGQPVRDTLVLPG